MNNHCSNCNIEFEDGFDVCWKCGSDKNGNSSQEFIRPEDQPEDPDGFIDALNFMGWLTGTFRVQKERDAEPRFKGDFVVPDWAVVPIVVLSGSLLAWFFRS